jgi:predicted Zn-dependent protease
MRTHNFKSARALAAAICLFSASVPAANAQFRLVSEKQELDAGRQADQQITQQYKVSRDGNYNNLVQHLGQRLTRVSDRPNLSWTFRVLDSQELNAFSVPGYVYVTTATIKACGNDQDELAGVIAHEVGHTCGKHAAKQMEKGAIGGLLVSILGSKNKSVASLASVAQNLVMLGYSRDDENDADRRAVAYTMKAGYDPRGLIRFFNYLQEHGDKGGGGITSYFKTHPPTPDRVSRVEKEIEKQGGYSTSRNANSSKNSPRRTYRTNRDDYNRDNYDRNPDDRP